ncbi:hypothetical protein FACS1894141_2370 [Spirochaetia bacterium]|nr:hypothetical protein FACS1894141_2370 [Spirochaetia bacterium]
MPPYRRIKIRVRKTIQLRPLSKKRGLFHRYAPVFPAGRHLLSQIPNGPPLRQAG